MRGDPAFEAFRQFHYFFREGIRDVKFSEAGASDVAALREAYDCATILEEDFTAGLEAEVHVDPFF